MKKLFVLTIVTMMAFALNSSAVFAENTKQNPEFKKPDISRERPKLYDKNGKELTAPPKKGEKVYDKNGKELTPPKFSHKPPKGPELNLTEEQIAKADKIRENSKQKLKPIRREIHSLKNEIWEIKENDNLTREEKDAKIEPIVKKIDGLKKKADEIRQADMKQFESILTSKQKKTLEAFKKTHKPCPKKDGHRPPCPPED